MVEQRVITEVVQVPSLEGWNWAVRSQDGEGNTHTHVFPADIFEWRAAEYNLDPVEDFETLLDMVLYGPFIPSPTVPDNFDQDPAYQAGKVSMATKRVGMVGVGDDVPTHLYNAPNIDEAREAHLMRVAHAKANRINFTTPQASLKHSSIAAESNDPLDVIRNFPGLIDPQWVEKKRQVVEKVRDQLISQAEQAPPKFSVMSRSMESAPQAMIRRPMRNEGPETSSRSDIMRLGINTEEE